MTTKFVMRYLATLSSSKGASTASTNNLCALEVRVLESNPILEGWGNARTLRNDNSSRFGKWISLDFDANGVLGRAAIRTYLLEKVRLVRQAEGERGFHIFYETIAMTPKPSTHWPQEDDLLDETVLVSGSSCGVDGRKDGVLDADMLAERLQALETFGVTGDDLAEVFDVLAAVVYLGGIDFDAVEASAVEDAQCRVRGDHTERLKVASTALGVDPARLETALIRREVTADGETLDLGLSAEAARRGRDALVKAVYSSLFDDLVARCNAELSKTTTNSKKKQNFSSIGLLDIFGFEVFQENSFEQLLINYTNERLQQHFNDFVFETEQIEYAAEGLEWDPVDFPNNDDVLALIEGSNKGSSSGDGSPKTSTRRNKSLPPKPLRRQGSKALPAASATAGVGLLATIDDECLLVAAKAGDAVDNDTDDMSARVLARRLKQTFDGLQRYQCDSKQERNAAFGINHYAGVVEYSVRGFIAKNMDALAPDAAKVLANSSRPFVRQLETRRMQSLNSSSSTAVVSSGFRSFRRSTSSLATTTVAQRFRSNLSALLLEIRGTGGAHFIRCLKPNDKNLPDLTDAPRLVEQLRYCGVLEAVRVARAGYPVRLPHSDFVRRYRAATSSSDLFFLRSKTAQPTTAASSMASGWFGSSTAVQEDDPLTLARKAAKALIDILAADAGLELETGKRTKSGDRGVALGRTKIFLRKGGFEALEALLSKRVAKAAIKVQTRWRRYVQRRRFVAQKTIATILREVYIWRSQRNGVAALTLQRHGRGYPLRRKYRSMLYVARQLERIHRGRSSRKALEWLRREKAVRRLQRLARGGAARGSFHQLRSAVISLQCFLRVTLAKEARRHQYRMRRDAALVLKELYKEQDRSAALAVANVHARAEAKEAEKRFETARIETLAERVALRRRLETANVPQLEFELAAAREALKVALKDRDDARHDRDATLDALSAAIAASGSEKRLSAEAAARASLNASKRDKEHRQAMEDKDKLLDDAKSAIAQAKKELSKKKTPVVALAPVVVGGTAHGAEHPPSPAKAQAATPVVDVVEHTPQQTNHKQPVLPSVSSTPPPPMESRRLSPKEETPEKEKYDDDDDPDDFAEEDEFEEAIAVGSKAFPRKSTADLKAEIAALRRLICGGWMAQWRMLCELGEDPIPEAEDRGTAQENTEWNREGKIIGDSDEFGPSAESLRETLGVDNRPVDYDYSTAIEQASKQQRRSPRKNPGTRVEPSALATRFAADIAALDAATAQLAGLRPPNRVKEQTPYAAALAETLLKMERSSGCLRALAAIEVSPFTPTELRDQLDTAYARLENLQRRIDLISPTGPRRRRSGSHQLTAHRQQNSAWLGIMSCGFYRDDNEESNENSFY